MIENFGGSVLYLILFLIQLLGLSFYCYLILLNPKSIINDYQVGDGAIAVIRLLGSFNRNLSSIYVNRGRLGIFCLKSNDFYISITL